MTDEKMKQIILSTLQYPPTGFEREECPSFLVAEYFENHPNCPEDDPLHECGYYGEWVVEKASAYERSLVDELVAQLQFDLAQEERDDKQRNE